MRRTIKHEDWLREARELFGDNTREWRFVCPVCKHVASVDDWLRAGAPQEAIAFSCVGRWIEGARDAMFEQGDGPCNYAGGGLFEFNPVEVVGTDGVVTKMFDFAPRQ